MSKKTAYCIQKFLLKPILFPLSACKHETDYSDYVSENRSEVYASDQNDSYLRAYWSEREYPYTADDAKEFISATLAADKDRVFAFAVEYEGRLAGSVGIYRCDNIHYRTAEVGYYIGEPFWGRGIASSAVRSACDYVFENTDIIRLFAEPFAYNAASCRVLEKSGFQLEGLLRSNAEKNGRILDMKMYSRIK